MKIKKILSALGALALGVGIAVIAVPVAAQAHTPSASADCQNLTVNLTQYQAEVPAKDAEGYTETKWVKHHEADTHKEWLYKQHQTGKEKWLDYFDWNPGQGWYYADQTRTVEDSPAWDEFKWAKNDPGHNWDSTGETRWVETKAAQPAKTNTVVVTIDGVQVDSQNFGTSFSNVYSLGNKYVAHTWTVTVDAHDGTQYDWTKSGTSTPCEIPVVEANHGATIVGSCGAATVTLTNAQNENEANQAASFVIYVDGTFYSAPAVAGGQSEVVNLTFAEDTGDHIVTVRTGPIQGDEFVAEATVSSDCEPNIVTVDPVEPQWIDPCGPDNGYWSYENGEGYSFNALPTGELILTADEGYAFPEGQTTWWQEHDSGEACPLTVIEDEILAPTFDDQCGFVNDKVNLPDDTELVTYEIAWSEDGNTATVTAIPAEGYTFPEETVTVWEHTFTDEACPTPATPEKPQGGLADTGVDPSIGTWVVMAVLLIAAGGAFALNNHRRNRRTAE